MMNLINKKGIIRYDDVNQRVQPSIRAESEYIQIGNSKTSNIFFCS